ncbi:DUF1127 domain-containing protein [Pseudomonas indica]|uniref:DUF1127 domain-containing protein n=1 Tax=Pseudomonas indica TaxID=137658 RepID=UPI000BAB30A1|nr:DUF1127 domain-containing protein [Pseudomonas indica]MBU3056056.1 DUF1127 domain-containing protein [Pseudomonas indica]PAU57217.1 hypothetical protein BZL42_15155 [Pseudomonas indica]
MKFQRGYAIASTFPQARHGFGRLLATAWKRLQRWLALAEQRRQLAALSDEALKDIGLSRADIYQESERPFWIDPLKR